MQVDLSVSGGERADLIEVAPGIDVRNDIMSQMVSPWCGSTRRMPQDVFE